MTEFTFTSSVTPAIAIANAQERECAFTETVTIKGQEYFTGRTAELQGNAQTIPGLSSNWIESHEYWALFLSCIQRARLKGMPIDDKGAVIVLGLPTKYY